MKLNEYKLSPEMEIEADRLNDEFLRDMEAAYEEAWEESHQPSKEDMAASDVAFLSEDITALFKGLRRKLKEAGASDEIIGIVRRYQGLAENLVDECYDSVTFELFGR